MLVFDTSRRVAGMPPREALQSANVEQHQLYGSARLKILLEKRVFRTVPTPRQIHTSHRAPASAGGASQPTARVTRQPSTPPSRSGGVCTQTRAARPQRPSTASCYVRRTRGRRGARLLVAGAASPGAARQRDGLLIKDRETIVLGSGETGYDRWARSSQQIGATTHHLKNRRRPAGAGHRRVDRTGKSRKCRHARARQHDGLRHEPAAAGGRDDAREADA